jgi:hypothetical protein
MQDRGGEEGEEQWVLSRFYPLLQDVLEDVVAGRLSDEEYPYVRHPPPATTQSEPLVKLDIAFQHFLPPICLTDNYG